MQLSRLMRPLSKVEIAITVCFSDSPSPHPLTLKAMHLVCDLLGSFVQILRLKPSEESFSRDEIMITVATTHPLTLTLCNKLRIGSFRKN